MDILKTYAENIFANLPQTSELNHLKDELLANMIDKYEELLDEGKRENEAIGIVISEFGHIDELLEELNLSPHEPNNKNVLTKNQVMTYLTEIKRINKFITYGVGTFIVAVAMFILIDQLMKQQIIFTTFKSDAISLIILFIISIPAIGLLIYAGLQMDKYKEITHGKNTLTSEAKTYVQSQLSLYHTIFTRRLIAGISLLIASPIILFSVESVNELGKTISLFSMLILAALGIMLIISVSTYRNQMDFLLQADVKMRRISNKRDKIIEATAAIVFPITIAIYLGVSFYYHNWGTSWIILVLVALLFGAFSGAYSIIVADED